MNRMMVVVLVFAAAGVWPVRSAEAIGPCEAQKQLAPRPLKHGPDRRAALAIGDSVMLGAADSLSHAGIRVNARGCRQMVAALDILAKHKQRGGLPRVVILEMGSNASVSVAEIQRALHLLTRRQLLVLVTPRGPDADAARIRRAGRRHPHRICVEDWAAASIAHPAWAPGDGLHLSYAGIDAFTRMLKPYRRVRPPQDGRPTRCP
jgi:hypothetical protein